MDYGVFYALMVIKQQAWATDNFHLLNFVIQGNKNFRVAAKN